MNVGRRVGAITRAPSAVLTRVELHCKVEPVERRRAQRRRHRRDQRAHSLGAVGHDLDFSFRHPPALIQSSGYQGARHRATGQRTGKPSTDFAVAVYAACDDFKLGDLLAGHRRQVGAVESHIEMLSSAASRRSAGMPANKELSILDALTAAQHIAPNGHVAWSTQAGDLRNDSCGNPV
jgi:hypothetical protein